MSDYMSVTEKATEWGISDRTVREMCQDGKIEGAMKVSRIWIIPASAERPKDGRVITGEYRNWRKK